MQELMSRIRTQLYDSLPPFAQKAVQQGDTLKWKAVVSGVRRRRSATLVETEQGQVLRLRPYIYVNHGDLLEIDIENGRIRNVDKVVVDSETGAIFRVKIMPPYLRTQTISVPPHELRVTFRERLAYSDWQQAKILEQFHYRGQGLNKIVGRRAVLLLELAREGVIGYGVLCATVAAAGPRFDLLDTDFKQQMRTKLINRIVRIPRIVIHPEFRGIGLGRLMAQHLIEYVRDYWHIRNYRPMLIEVMASMTEYHPFFERAGFLSAGETAGYDKKIFIPKYGQGHWESRPNHKQYNFFRHGKPKPYLVYPLTDEARRLLQSKGVVSSEEVQVAQRRPRLKQPVICERVSVRYRVANANGERTQTVRDAFGVDEHQLQSPVLRDFSLRINPGDVVLITGASGSGKSTVIALLTRGLRDLDKDATIGGRVLGHRRSNVAELGKSWTNNLPLIDQLGNTVREAIALLNGVGLGEAHLYLKRPSQISDGQKYRFAVALLCHSGKPLWIADEFASTLDPVTSAIVAKGLRKIAWLSGATLVLAAPHVGSFIGSLLPNKLVSLRWGTPARLLSLILKYQSSEAGLRASILNTCKDNLTGVQIGGLDGFGHFAPFLTHAEVRPGNRTDEVKLQWDALDTFVAVAARTREQVGDIVYLSRTARDSMQ